MNFTSEYHYKEPQPIIIGDDRLELSDSDSELSSSISATQINSAIFDPTESIRPHALAHAELGFSENIGRALKEIESQKVDINRLREEELENNRGLKDSIKQKGAAQLNCDYRKKQYTNLVSLDVGDVNMFRGVATRGEIPSSSRSNQSQVTNHMEPNILEFFTDDLQVEKPHLPSYNNLKYEVTSLCVETIDDISNRIRFHQTSSLLEK